ncbi:type II secretion system minor pseudopilin GspI [Profundibacterium mesophilum]|uniref:Type II secretion system protein I n=1 Tax=Profundibacterium mesophilum KAUST100406-0324 TaxID=1037889 RepID=A0A921TEW1_9RHOB|nr:type II secretion system minor pseudopilin GspI [Profundibacterium mesophilum]KAF0675839.1 General secretion pathway protein I [Profundibacterium mesophilum KAUST100406-0324]
MSGRATDAGFTLIEALVAMAVLATSAMTLLAAVETHIGRIGALEQRSAARWVAQNTLAAVQLGLPAPRVSDMLGEEWTIETERRPTEDPDLEQVTVTVGRPREDARGGVAGLVTLLGFADTGGTR